MLQMNPIFDRSAGWNQWSLPGSTMQNYNSDDWGFVGIREVP